MQPAWSRVPMELNLANQGWRFVHLKRLWAGMAEVLRGTIGYDPAMMYSNTKPNCTSLNEAEMWQTK